MVSIRSFVWILLTGALVAAGLWLASRIESTESLEYTGLEGEARDNPLLMLDYFLLQMGQPVVRMDVLRGNLARLQANDTLILYNDRTYLDNQTSMRLLAWIRSGGHLLMFGAKNEISTDVALKEDRLLKTLGVRILPAKEAPKQLKQSDDSEYGTAIYKFVPKQGAAKTQSPLSVQLSLRHVVESRAKTIWRMGDDIGVRGAQYSYGKGIVTVFADLEDFLTNNIILSHDHGVFAWLLLESPGGNVYYSVFDQGLNLFEWLWIKAPYVMITVALIVLFCIWYALLRQGPVLDPVQPLEQRPFLEHFRAAGRFLWHAKNSHALLEPVRRAILRDGLKRFPHWTQWEHVEKIQALQNLSGLDAIAIEQALFGTPRRKPEAFRRAMQTLATLRKTL